MTPAKRARILQAEKAFRSEQRQLQWDTALPRIMESLTELFANMEKHCEKINVEGDLHIRHETSSEPQANHRACIATDNRVGVIVRWRQPYMNTLDNSSLEVELLNGRLLLREDPQRGGVFMNRPKLTTGCRHAVGTVLSS